MNKNEKDGYDSNFKRDNIIAEVLLRITALENLLIAKGIVSNDEIQDQLKVLSTKISNIISANNETKKMEASKEQEEKDDELDEEYGAMLGQFALTTKKISKGN